MKKIISYIFLTIALILGCTLGVLAAEKEHTPADIPGLTFDQYGAFLCERVQCGLL